MGEWEEYKQLFGKVYNGDEDSSRKAIFESNRLMWGDHESGAVLGATQFSDMTLEEFQAMPIRGFAAGSDLGLPKLGEHTSEEFVGSVDWTTRGAVTPVKNQGQCGSCWAFSTTGGLEGAWQVATGKLASFSEEQLVDCDKGGNGCHGGLMDQGFEFLQTVDVCSEQSYPYTAGSGHEGSCKSQCDVAIPKGSVTGHMDVDHSEEALMSALMKGPVSIAIEADQSSFQHYTSGVLTAACGSQLDHGVLAVGYGEEDGTKYWKVKNSWGSSWGDAGYIRIERGASQHGGECGILMSASYPVVNGDAPPAPPSPPTPTPPAPTPTPPSGQHHYGEPPCMSDEMAGQLQGGGVLCAPKCDASGGCTTDVDPSCTKPKPQCVLQDQSGDKYCALTCGFLKGNCPSGAKCSSPISGVCTYPSQTSGLEELFIPDKSSVVV